MKTVALSGLEDERLVGTWLAVNCAGPSLQHRPEMAHAFLVAEPLVARFHFVTRFTSRLTVPVEPADLPPYRHWGPCPQCGRHRPILVHFDRDCTEVRGDHYHRVCPCGHRWVERCTE